MCDDEKVVNCGAFGLSKKKTAQILTLNKEEQKVVIKQLGDSKSELAGLYEAGQTRSLYDLMLKLFEMARAGDIQAIKEFERRKKENKLEDE